MQLERLLFDVDDWSCFTEAFMGGGTGQPSSRRAVLAALMAHGTNIGLTEMINNAENFVPGELVRASRRCLRTTALREANRRLVDFHASIPMAKAWGTGQRSSSDGQRFGLTADSLLGSYYPRYFGYYDKAVCVYTHTSDLHTVYSTRVISCGPREALWVLGGLLDNDTVLEPAEHHVDTHGATEALFGMCFLLGFQLQPSFAKLHKVKLYKTSRKQNMGELEPLFSGVINTKLICSQWDALMRVAASLRHGKAPAHVVMRRLTKAPSRLSKALVDSATL